VHLIVALLVVAAPPDSGTIRLEVQHEGALIIGTIDEVPVTIYAPDVGEEDRPLRVSTNVGTFGDVKRESDGRYTTSFRLPTTRHPQVALVAVWRETGPNAPITFLRIPLYGKTTLPVGTTRGAKVTVNVGQETFGPVEANAKGKAVVPIVVPPGVLDVLARSIDGTTESQKTVPVDLPPYNRLTLAVTPHVIEANGRSSCTAHVFYDSDAPPRIDQVSVTAPGGTVTPIGGENGRYRYTYVPERGKNEAEVALTVRVAKDKTSKAETLLSLGTPVPQQLVIKPHGDPLYADGRAKDELQILLMDKLGLGIPGKKLTASTDVGKLGELRELGDGRYSIVFTAPEEYPAAGRANVSVVLADRKEVTRSIELAISPPPWPAKATVSIDPSLPISDGSSFIVDVTATDIAGRPFEKGLVLTASAAAVSPIQYLGEGHYRAEVKPSEGLESIDIAVKHPSGQFSYLHRTQLRAPPPFLTLAAKVGGAYHLALTWSVAVELGFRIPVGERRFTLFGSVGYRPVNQRLKTIPANFPADAQITSMVQMLPIGLGVTYDLLVGESWRMYLAAAGMLVPFKHHIDTNDLFDTPTNYSVGGGGEATFGFEVYGVLFELAGGYTYMRSMDLDGPDWLVMLNAGYRLGLF
jgi:hypothetical protein